MRRLMVLALYLVPIVSFAGKAGAVVVVSNLSNERQVIVHFTRPEAPRVSTSMAYPEAINVIDIPNDVEDARLVTNACVIRRRKPEGFGEMIKAGSCDQKPCNWRTQPGARVIGLIRQSFGIAENPTGDQDIRYARWCRSVVHYGQSVQERYEFRFKMQPWRAVREGYVGALNDAGVVCRLHRLTASDPPQADSGDNKSECKYGDGKGGACLNDSMVLPDPVSDDYEDGVIFSITCAVLLSLGVAGLFWMRKIICRR